MGVKISAKGLSNNINSTINIMVKSNKSKSAGLAFPIMAEVISVGIADSNMVVLFSNNTTGMVIMRGNNSAHEIGYISTNWYPVDDDSYWKILPPGTIINLIQK